ncbi:glycolate oxidase subunit GlcE [Massilia sp. NR 4-1]|uniref:glycolate oxidase subunit GlcE n=1 Tax=Massilia sp. NR 4-1 TaxID=1678028 RepID=UPI00067CB9E4|nr:glycolate oxidase [Massilia sp. NR 4-1]
MQSILAGFIERIHAATAQQSPLRLRGGGSKDWYGQSLQGEVLDTRSYSGVVDYEPTELVITARCGTPLAEIEALLAQHGQMLAFEPPRFSQGGSADAGAARVPGLRDGGTIGGVVAAGLSGPRRASAGAVRDFVLGAQLLDGRGEVLNFGGQVMKNVAGYDVARLLAGSLGTLGLITQVSLKVLPLPPREATIRFEMDEIGALRYLNEWAGQPLPISASCWHRDVLTVRLSGAEAAVQAALRRLGGAPLDDGAAFWAALRDQTHEYFSGGALWRLALPPAASAQVLRGEQLIEWGGAQRWLKAADADADRIRRSVAAAGGHATLYRRDAAPQDAPSVFHPLQPAVARIHERLKLAFDPAGIFNPGRMY